MSHVKKFMNQARLTLSALAIMIAGAVSVNAQTPASPLFEKGYQYIYYENYPAAIETLKQAMAQTPTSPEVIYWLGVAYLNDKQTEAAKALFQKSIAGGVKHPLIEVGVAHARLLEGADNTTLRPMFDAAIASSKSLPKKAQADVLNAIGLANASGGMKQGDNQYGIDMLNQSLKLDPNNPVTYVSKCLSYLKQGPEAGSPAIAAFNKALDKNPKYAKAAYRIGRMYQSQMSVEPMLEKYQEIMKMDPKYTPVYLTLFNYYREREVNEAIKYLDLFAANTTLNCDMEYFVADYYFRAGRYSESLAKGHTMDAGACKGFYRLPVLYSMNNNRLGDSVKALAQMEQYFKTAPADKVDKLDYEYAAELAQRFTDKIDLCAQYYSKAMDLDTSANEKAKTAQMVAAAFEKAGRFTDQLEWLRKATALRGTTSSADYYNMCMSATNAKNMTVLDEIASLYMDAYPDQPQGYSFKINAAKALDTDTTKGLAIEPINKYNTLLEKDLDKNRKRIYSNLYYQLLHYVQYIKDLEKGNAVLDKMIALYPDPASEENKFAMQVKQQISATPKKK